MNFDSKMKVEVTLLKAKGLKDVNGNGKADPFIMFKSEKTYKTKSSEKKCLDPEWDEKFQIEVPNPYESIIKFEILDKKTDMGECLFNFKVFEKVDEEYPKTLDVVLNGKNCGELEIKIKILNFTAKEHYEKFQEKYKEIRFDILKKSKEKKGKKSFKILVLGTGECGKTTLIKQIAFLNNVEYTEEAIQEYTKTIYSNIIETMIILVNITVKKGLEVSEENKEIRDKIFWKFQKNMKRIYMKMQ